MCFVTPRASWHHIHKGTDGLLTHTCGQTPPPPLTLCTQERCHSHSQYHPWTSPTHIGPSLAGLIPSSWDPWSLPPTLPSPPWPPPLFHPVLFPGSYPPTHWPPAQLRAVGGVGWLFLLPRLLGCGHWLMRDENAETCLF